MQPLEEFACDESASVLLYSTLLSSRRAEQLGSTKFVPATSRIADVAVAELQRKVRTHAFSFVLAVLNAQKTTGSGRL